MVFNAIDQRLRCLCWILCCSNGLLCNSSLSKLQIIARCWNCLLDIDFDPHPGLLALIGRPLFPSAGGRLYPRLDMGGFLEK